MLTKLCCFISKANSIKRAISSDAPFDQPCLSMKINIVDYYCSEADLRAAAEVATSTAVGAARPSAQGQATVSTLHASCRLRSSPPALPAPRLLQ